jgi:hypothetical protein
MRDPVRAVHNPVPLAPDPAPLAPDPAPLAHDPAPLPRNPVPLPRDPVRLPEPRHSRRQGGHVGHDFDSRLPALAPEAAALDGTPGDWHHVM